MATYTEHYNLKKPDTTDYVNIQDLNGNADIIDAALAGKAEAADVSAKYTKPETGIPATDLAADVQTSLGKADTAIQATEKGATNGVATLDGAGKVPASQLPSYVDDVIEGYYYNGAFYSDSAHTEQITPETGIIYVDLHTDDTYRWSGSVYVRINDITVDDALSDTSTNPVQNKVITEALSEKAPVVYDTASGSIASFDDGADDMPIKSLVVNIEPVQAGSGDPSPTNICPIEGYTDCNIARTGKNLIPFPYTTASGTISGASVSYGSNGEIVITGSATEAGNVYLIRENLALKSGSYTASVNGPHVGATVFVRDRDNSVNLARIDTNSLSASVTFTIAEDITNGMVYINWPGAVSAMNFNCTIQLELGSTATEYELYQGQTYPISWETEAGIVYGGSLDVTTGLLTVDRAIYKSPTVVSVATGSTGVYYADITNNIIPSNRTFICNMYKKVDTVTQKGETGIRVTASHIYVYDDSFAEKSISEATEMLFELQIVYKLTSPIIYNLTPQQITTLLGTNNVWADCGPVSVDYPADTKLYIQKINAPTDDDMTADTQIASGKYFLIGNTLYLSTTIIPAGDTIIPGTNCTKTNLAAALNALNT